MNQNLQWLFKIATKQERKIIGLMSGTSLDGLDVALCSFKGSGGETVVKLLNYETVNFSEETKYEIRKVFAKKEIDFQQLCVLNPWIGNLHGRIVIECLDKWKVSSLEVDIIASHGQTVFHAPKSFHGLDKFANATLQIGDGDHVSVATGIIVLSDFRQKHIAAGGEGAPLAVYGDYLIFSCKGENRIMLNIGGIANFTYLPGTLNAAEVFSTDTGPGNTLLDACARKLFNKEFDEDGKFATGGKINIELLVKLKTHDFFGKAFPKTTGPEMFNLEYLENAQVQSDTLDISPEDVMATLTRFTSETIADAIRKCFSVGEVFSIYSSGGGNQNPAIVTHLTELLPGVSFFETDTLGIPGDAKEAVLFATLANEAIFGGRTDFGSRQGVPNISMGKISFPK